MQHAQIFGTAAACQPAAAADATAAATTAATAVAVSVSAMEPQQPARLEQRHAQQGMVQHFARARLHDEASTVSALLELIIVYAWGVTSQEDPHIVCGGARKEL